MARLELIVFSPIHPDFDFANILDYKAISEEVKVDSFPQLYWKNRFPWNAANLYLHSRVNEIIRSSISVLTLVSIAKSLLAYMRFLEEYELAWDKFNYRESVRPLNMYRGYLIDKRNKGQIASSLASFRMNSVLNFYRWTQDSGVIEAPENLCADTEISFSHITSNGLIRKLKVRSSRLAVPNRSRRGTILEDGLQPISKEDRDALLEVAKERASIELYLMLLLGFYTGMRIGSICDLKIKTLETAFRHHSTPELFWIRIGPGAIGAPVKTKNNVNGEVIIPRFLLMELLVYVKSPRRLIRAAKAPSLNKGHVFLNRNGRSYYDEKKLGHPTVDVEMSRLRKKIGEKSISTHHFKFHQTRATFATNVAEIALANCGENVGGAIALVRELLLHKNESTSMRYIKFVQEHGVLSKWADDFTRDVIQHAISVRERK